LNVQSLPEHLPEARFEHFFSRPLLNFGQRSSLRCLFSYTFSSKVSSNALPRIAIARSRDWGLTSESPLQPPGLTSLFPKQYCAASPAENSLTSWKANFFPLFLFSQRRRNPINGTESAAPISTPHWASASSEPSPSHDGPFVILGPRFALLEWIPLPRPSSVLRACPPHRAICTSPPPQIAAPLFPTSAAFDAIPWYDLCCLISSL